VEPVHCRVSGANGHETRCVEQRRNS
jgi:hypothetical protein